MQHNLLQEMLHRVEVGRRAYICPPPPSVMSPTLDNFTLPAKCAGCGYGHNVNEAVMLVVLPCKHTYHSVCFATLCAFTDQCMVQYCSMAIPRDAQSTVIWGDGKIFTSLSVLPSNVLMLLSIAAMLDPSAIMLFNSATMLANTAMYAS